MRNALRPRSVEGRIEGMMSLPRLDSRQRNVMSLLIGTSVALVRIQSNFTVIVEDPGMKP